MIEADKNVGELIVNQTSDTKELLSKNRIVLSCGGIYIPRRFENGRVFYHVLSTSNETEPVKVFTGARPNSALHDVLIKESMN